MAKGMVWVSPAILDTKVMVAPNSPKERAKPSTIPARIPGKDNGKVIVKNTRHAEAPSVLAACSNFKSILSRESRIARTTKGNATTAEANTAPFQLNPKVNPNH